MEPKRCVISWLMPVKAKVVGWLWAEMHRYSDLLDLEYWGFKVTEDTDLNLWTCQYFYPVLQFMFGWVWVQTALGVGGGVLSSWESVSGSKTPGWLTPLFELDCAASRQCSTHPDAAAGRGSALKDGPGNGFSRKQKQDIWDLTFKYLNLFCM